MGESQGNSKRSLLLFGLVGVIVLFLVVYFLLPASMVPWIYPG